MWQHMKKRIKTDTKAGKKERKKYQYLCKPQDNIQSNKCVIGISNKGEGTEKVYDDIKLKFFQM